MNVGSRGFFSIMWSDADRRGNGVEPQIESIPGLVCQLKSVSACIATDLVWVEPVSGEFMGMADEPVLDSVGVDFEVEL